MKQSKDAERETNRHQKMKQYLKLQNYLMITSHVQRKRGRRFMTTRKRFTTIAECCNTLSTKLQFVAYKGEPHRVLLNSNRLSASGFETWRQLHATYDQLRIKDRRINIDSTTTISQLNHEPNVEQHDSITK
eukprot:6458555-Amphidinium_carterae.1